MTSEPPNVPAQADPLPAPVDPLLAPADPLPAEPVSRVKEWAVAVALMIVFAIICAQFITFLRSNPYSNP